MPGTKKHIVLIDFTLIGHHFAFCCSFCRILIQQGYRVSILVPDGQQIMNWIEKEMPEGAEDCKVFEYDYKPVNHNGWGLFNDAKTALHRWKAEAAMIRNIEKNTGEKVDIVFYAWLDNNLASKIPAWMLDRIFKWKWTGLYFHPYHLRQNDFFLKKKANWRDHDAVFLSKNCLGVAVHDAGILDDFSKRIGKPVIHFPETADSTPPDLNNPVYLSIKKKANGRLTTGMIGCEGHKGTLTLIRAAKAADPANFFFVFIGILPAETYSEDEWLELQNFFSEDRENIFTYFHHLREGAEYNAVFCAFDIPYLVYDNFISSSNRLTKAAIFEKLVLAQDNYCVGDDVKRFDLGEAIKPKDPQKVLDALDKLGARIAAKDYPFENWKRYREMNSNDILFVRFKELLQPDTA